jgi:hypothetical protein
MQPTSCNPLHATLSPLSLEAMSTNVLFFGNKAIIVASRSGSLQKYTNQRLSLPHFVVNKKTLMSKVEDTIPALDLFPQPTKTPIVSILITQN